MAESPENYSNNIVETLAQVLTNSETLQQFQNLESRQDDSIFLEENTSNKFTQQASDANKVSNEQEFQEQIIEPTDANKVSNEQEFQEQIIEPTDATIVNQTQPLEPIFTTGRAPIKTPENDPNYNLSRESAEQGNPTALIHTQLTPENLDTAAKLLLQNTEFKDYIGQYALSNDSAQNLQTIRQGIIEQKNYTVKPDYVGEVDGQAFTGGEAYFLDQLLLNLQNSDAIDSFFSQLRDQINTEVLQKIEQKEEKQTTSQLIEPQDSSQLETTIENTKQQSEEDPFLKAKKIITEREGELIEDLTPDESWSELRRILNSPEYKQAQIEDIGYDPEKGHPDPEIQKYLDDMETWRKQLPFPEFNEPVKPENYEQRLNQPKVDFENQKKQENKIETSALSPQSLESSSNRQFLNEDKNLKFYSSQTASDTINSTQLETQTELPTKDMFAELEQFEDKNSEKILSNTEKTNTVLDRLTQMFATFIQMGGVQTQKAIPEQTFTPDIANTGTPQQGIPDAVLASKQSIIPTIRNKFIYSV